MIGALDLRACVRLLAVVLAGGLSSGCGAALANFAGEHHDQRLAIVAIGMATMWHDDDRNPLLPVAVDQMRQLAEARLGRSFHVVPQDTFRDTPGFRAIERVDGHDLVVAVTERGPLPWFGRWPIVDPRVSWHPRVRNQAAFVTEPDLDPVGAAELARVVDVDLVATVFVRWSYCKVSTVIHVYDASGALVLATRFRSIGRVCPDYSERVPRQPLRFDMHFDWADLLPRPDDIDAEGWLRGFDEALRRQLQQPE